jgi:type II secretory pathway component PulF
MDEVAITWPTLLILGLVLRIGLRLHYGARGPEEGDPVFALVNTSGWVLIVLGAIPLIILCFISFIGIVIVLLAIATCIDYIVTLRSVRKKSAAALLALMLGRADRLSPAVAQAGQSVGGSVGRALKGLLRALEVGVPLDECVVRFPSALPQEAVAYLAAGETPGARAAALRELARAEGAAETALWRSGIDRLLYLSCVLFVLLAIVVFMMLKIVPSMHAIFDDFGLELPSATSIVLDASQFFMKYLTAPLLLLAPLIVAILVAVAVSQLAGVPIFRPLTDQLFRSRRTADVLLILSVSAQERQPLTRTLGRLADVYPSTVIRRQLARAAAAIHSGVDWRQALNQAGIVTSAETALLGTAGEVGNLPWVLRTIAERRKRLSIYRLTAAVQIFYPIAILMLAAVIGFFVVAMFVPLVDLIHGLVESLTQ